MGLINQLTTGEHHIPMVLVISLLRLVEAHVENGPFIDDVRKMLIFHIVMLYRLPEGKSIAKSIELYN